MKSNYGWGLPIQASTYAAKIDHSLMILHAAMFLIFGLWAVYMVYCLIRYRRAKNPQADYSFKDALAAYTPDVLILVFEIWLIFLVGVPIWAHIKEDLPKAENATEIRVVAEQFAWTVHYPGADGKFGKAEAELVNADNPLGLDPNDPDGKDDIVSVNTLVIPLGRPVLIHLSSKDVIHSFFIPEFRIKQDAVPGMKINVWVEPAMTGLFELSCAQLCGTGHYRMRADVIVKTQADYEAWLQGELKLKGT